MNTKADTIEFIGETDAFSRNARYLTDIFDKIRILETVSGYSIDSLIALFDAGYVIGEPKLELSNDFLNSSEGDRYVREIARRRVEQKKVEKLAEKIARESKLPAYFFREVSDSIKKRDKFIETVKVEVDEDGKIVATIDEPHDELLERFKESEEEG